MHENAANVFFICSEFRSTEHVFRPYFCIANLNLLKLRNATNNATS